MITDESDLVKWLKLSKELTLLKEKEVALRRAICGELFNGKSGEFKIKEVSENCKITAESKVNRTIDKVTLKLMWDDLSEEEQDCIRYVPEIALANYRKLSDDSQLHEVITEKQSPTPVLKVVVKE